MKSLLFCLILASSFRVWAAQPLSVYLTWQTPDTATRITVNILTKSYRDQFRVTLYESNNFVYHQTKKASDSKEYALLVGHTLSYSFSNLKPDSLYNIVLKSHQGESYSYNFKTLPKKGGKLHFVQGGDMNTEDNVISVAQGSIAQVPDAILIGGDIAYGNGLLPHKWLEWFERMNHVMVHEGRLIPLVLAIGNHEVVFKFKDLFDFSRSDRVPFFFKLFPQGGTSFFTRNFSDHTVLFVLDSGHDVKHKDQVGWLDQEMKTYQNTPNKMALYHVPLYPSIRSPKKKHTKLGRKHWLPVFDKHHLTLALENHDHSLKRTFPLKGGKTQHSYKSGTLYIGDGCWGAPTRQAKKQRSYVEIQQEKNHVWNLYTSKSGIVGVAKNNEAKLDQFEISH